MPRTMLCSLCFLSLLALPGCAQTVWRRSESIVDLPDFKIELEQIYFEGEPKSVFAHPAEVSPIALENAFGSLAYRPRTLFGDPVPKPTIVPEYLAPLAAQVSVALARASDSERVRFEMREGGTSLYILPSTTTTRGVVFLSTDGVLNLAFDEVHALPEIDDAGARSGWGNPTRRARSTGTLAVPEYATVGVTVEGRAMPLWAAFPLDRIPSTAPPRVATDPVPSPAGAKPIPTGDPATLTDREVLSRLRFLEELYQEGSLTEEQYRAKRAELLGTGKSK